MAVREGRWTRVRRVRRAREDMNGGIVAVACVWMKLTVPYDFLYRGVDTENRIISR
jgi:hypothetical protein